MKNRKFLLFPALFAVAITLTACDGTVNLTGSVPYTEGENKTLENTSEEVSETENKDIDDIGFTYNVIDEIKSRFCFETKNQYDIEQVIDIVNNLFKEPEFHGLRY